VVPRLQQASLPRAVALGAFFGFVADATFDLTSLALIRDFPTRVVLVDLVDLLWGSI
jgi:uncharacterized membrane protein